MTAVEYLVEQLNEIGFHTIVIQSIIDKAKAMEKKQMKKAYNDGRPNLLCYEKGTAFKEYYNETFNK